MRLASNQWRNMIVLLGLEAQVLAIAEYGFLIIKPAKVAIDLTYEKPLIGPLEYCRVDSTRD